MTHQFDDLDGLVRHQFRVLENLMACKDHAGGRFTIITIHSAKDEAGRTKAEV
jgi:hypothetical protein